MTNNYWGTTDPSKIADAIYDFFDSSQFGVVLWDPPLPAPDIDSPPVVTSIVLTPPPPVSAERVTFTVTFSKPMNATAFPEVFFGPAPPFTSHPVDLNPVWLDPQTFQVEADITVFTGDGLQTITIWNAEDLEAFPIPTGDHRFGFEIVTSGTSAAQLSAVGDVGHVELSWFASDLPDAAGYNLYRSESSGGPYTKLNSAVIVDTTYADHTALPGVPYFYIYRVVTTDLLEGPDSDEASGTALDTVAPEIVHSAVSQAPAGQRADAACHDHRQHRRHGGKRLPPAAGRRRDLCRAADDQRRRRSVHGEHFRWRHDGAGGGVLPRGHPTARASPSMAPPRRTL